MHINFWGEILGARAIDHLFIFSCKFLLNLLSSIMLMLFQGRSFLGPQLCLSANIDFERG